MVFNELLSARIGSYVLQFGLIDSARQPSRILSSTKEITRWMDVIDIPRSCNETSVVCWLIYFVHANIVQRMKIASHKRMKEHRVSQFEVIIQSSYLRAAFCYQRQTWTIQLGMRTLLAHITNLLDNESLSIVSIISAIVDFDSSTLSATPKTKTVAPVIESDCQPKPSNFY